MTTTAPSLPPLYPFDEVIERYQLNRRGVYEAARAKKFEHTHIGRGRYFTEQQLAKFLAERTVTSTRQDDLAGVRDRRARRRTPAGKGGGH